MYALRQWDKEKGPLTNCTDRQRLDRVFSLFFWSTLAEFLVVCWKRDKKSGYSVMLFIIVDQGKVV
jgi:hypothetical protein